MASDICRWGFLSTAGIGKKNWHAIRCCENATLVAVASRETDKANQFIGECQRQIPFENQPKAVGGYETLLSQDDIDAVYIPLPTALRKQWVIAAAEAGKHVMCEKPCAIHHSDLREMIDACEKNGVQFMDGVMLMHTQRLSNLRPCLESKIGDLLRVHSQLSFKGDQEFLDQNIRTDSSLEPLGCLGDLGWYNVRIALFAANWQMPHSVTAKSLNSLNRTNGENGVPLSMSAELFFENGLSAGFYCSFEAHHQQWAVFSGTHGMIKLNDFVLPYSNEDLKFELHNPTFDIDACQFVMLENKQTISTAESGNNAVDSQEAKLFRYFSSIVNAGNIDPFWGEISMKTQCVVDACFESANSDGKLTEVSKL